MPPRRKPLDAPVSSASFLDLKAQLSKHEDDLHKSRQSGQPSHLLGGVGRTAPAKKLPLWARTNKGLAHRQARDQQVVLVEGDGPGTGPTPQQIQNQLEKKAALYDKIRRGKTAGLTDAQIDALLVDFDRHSRSPSSGAASSPEPEEGDSDDDDAARTPAAPLTHTHDPLVEYTDEFGRTRLVPRSEVPRGAPFRDPNGGGPVSVPVPVPGAPADKERPRPSSAAVGEGPDPSNIYYGDQTSFPVYAPDPAVLARRAATLAAAAAAPLVDHYSASGENRTRGAGFYAFSADEAQRQKEMEALARAREETERNRAEGGGGGAGDKVKREREKEREDRKRRIEEKRRQVEDKRRRATAGDGDGDGAATVAAKRVRREQDEPTPGG